MAMDVILPFERDLNRALNFTDLTDVKTIRGMLENFKSSNNLTSTTKLKHLAVFEQFMKFLLMDCDSPELESPDTAEELLLRDAKAKLIFHEIETSKTIISKMRGADRVATVNKAKEKLISDEDTKELMEELTLEVTALLNMSDEEVSNLTMKQVLNYRNVLMAIPTLRLARRSKELMTMNVKEVKNSEEKEIDGEIFRVILVADQKHLKSGQQVTIAYTREEFAALEVFIEKMRPRLADKFQTNVFPVKKNMKHGSSKEISFSSAWKILQSFETKSGKKLSSRVIRGSRVTNRNREGLSDAERRDMASAMKHSVSTADRYYNYSSTTDSVLRHLSLEKKLKCRSSNPISSTPTQQSSSTQIISDDNESPITPRGMKRKLFVKDSQSSTDVSVESTKDSKLVTLRGKKIMKSTAEIDPQEKSKQLGEVKIKIRQIVNEHKNNGTLKSLLTKNGAVSIQPVSQVIPKSILKLFSVKQLRKLFVDELSKELLCISWPRNTVFR